MIETEVEELENIQKELENDAITVQDIDNRFNLMFRNILFLSYTFLDWLKKMKKLQLFPEQISQEQQQQHFQQQQQQQPSNLARQKWSDLVGSYWLYPLFSLELIYMTVNRMLQDLSRKC